MIVYERNRIERHVASELTRSVSAASDEGATAFAYLITHLHLPEVRREGFSHVRGRQHVPGCGHLSPTLTRTASCEARPTPRVAALLLRDHLTRCRLACSRAVPKLHDALLSKPHLSHHPLILTRASSLVPIPPLRWRRIGG